MNKYTLLLIFFLASMPAFAYIGPGMSGGVIAAIIGFLVAIFVGLWGILYYPIKRALKRRKETKMSSNKFTNDSE